MYLTRDTLNAAVDFDRVFALTPNADRDAALISDNDEYAPDVTDDGKGGVWISPDDKWTALTGHTGQHGYSGPIMHVSETLSGGLADRLIRDGGTYVIVEVRDEDGTYPDDGPIGWAVLKLNEDPMGTDDATDDDLPEYARWTNTNAGA